MLNNVRYYLGFDFGASSGRAILGMLGTDPADGKKKLELEEVYRFPNEAVRVGGVLKWEMKRLKKMKVNLPRNGEYPDVVLADYQDSLEKQWVAQLKKKYKVVVFHSMLTTLNIH